MTFHRRNHFKCAIVHALLWASMLLAANGSYAAAVNSRPPAEGEMLPDIRLAVPEDPVHRAYLGVKGAAPFTIPEIDADIVIVEIFSMYCPHCQREAPTINQI